MTADDVIRSGIRAKRVAWLKATKVRRDEYMYDHYRRQLEKFLGEMETGRVYSMRDIEILVAKFGARFASTGGALTYGVRHGYFNRVGHGRYLVTGKKLEE